MFIVGESCLPGAEVEGPDIQSKVGLFVFVEYHFCGGYDIVLVSRYIFDSKHSKKKKKDCAVAEKTPKYIFFQGLKLEHHCGQNHLCSGFDFMVHDMFYVVHVVVVFFQMQTIIYFYKTTDGW